MYDVLQALVIIIFLIHIIPTEILCPQIKAPLHGKVIISGYTPLSKALYACKKGYKLVGLLLRKCLANGSWFGSAPTCQLIKH